RAFILLHVPTAGHVYVIERQLVDSQISVRRPVVVLPQILSEVTLCGGDPERTFKVDAASAAFDNLSRRPRVEVDCYVEFVTVGITDDEAVFEPISRKGIIDVA